MLGQEVGPSGFARKRGLNGAHLVLWDMVQMFRSSWMIRRQWLVRFRMWNSGMVAHTATSTHHPETLFQAFLAAAEKGLEDVHT